MLKSKPNFVHAFGEAVIDLLQRGVPVHLAGIGTWRVEHEPSRMEPGDGGDPRVVPPRDRIAFEPDPS